MDGTGSGQSIIHTNNCNHKGGNTMGRRMLSLKVHNTGQTWLTNDEGKLKVMLGQAKQLGYSYTAFNGKRTWTTKGRKTNGEVCGCLRTS